MPYDSPRLTPYRDRTRQPRCRCRVVRFACLLIVLAGAQTSQAQEPESSNPKQSAAEPDTIVVSQEWVAMAPEGAKATFDLPAKPSYIERSIEPIAGRGKLKVRIHLATIDDGRSTFLVSYHDLHDTPNSRKTIDETLLGAIGGSVFMVEGQLIGDPKEKNQRGASGREYRYTFTKQDRDFEVLARVYLDRNRVYQLAAVMERRAFDEGKAERFLKSFQLKPLEKSDSPQAK